jgi:hypothetical protein
MYMQLIYMLNVKAFSAVHAFQMTPYRHRRTTSKKPTFQRGFVRSLPFHDYLTLILI